MLSSCCFARLTTVLRPIDGFRSYDLLRVVNGRIIAYALFEARVSGQVYFVQASDVEAARMHKRNKKPPCRKIVLIYRQRYCYAVRYF